MIGGTEAFTAVDRLGWLSVIPSQVADLEVEGGPVILVLLGIGTFLVASVLAVIVTYRFIEGYRRTGSRPILLLAVGMFFLAPAPMFARLFIANVEAIPLTVQMLVASLSELTGLLVVLYVIYTR
jgi:hypothetical protein